MYSGDFLVNFAEILFDYTVFREYKMNKLSDETARLISSLQVITKVESVVKELVENAFDAGASSIEVKFENYGLSRIEVRDNGSGIKQDNVEYAAQKHHTSKISSADDLKTISSYGFRGEALSSLCQVAEIFITTRTKTDCFSSKYSFNDKGIVTAVKPSHLGKGTTVVACNIFSKMPVRCQFYQTETKKKQIMKNTEDILMAFALIHPETKILFYHNKCLIWQTPACKDSLTTLQNIIGTQVTSQLKQIDHYCSQNNIHIWALIPTTRQTRCFRKTADRIFIFVNERPVRDKEIERIIKQNTSLPTSNQMKFPLFVLSIKLPSHNVDPNVESDKSRVMIVNKEALLNVLEEMFNQAYQLFCNEAEKENVDTPENVSKNPCISNNPISRPNNELDDVSFREKMPLSGNISHIEDTDKEAASPSVDKLKNPTKELHSNLDACHANFKSGSVPAPVMAEGKQQTSVDTMQLSKGHSGKTSNGADVQPVKILVGNHGKPNLPSDRTRPDRFIHSLDPDPDDVTMIEQVHLLAHDTSSCWNFLKQNDGRHSNNSSIIDDQHVESTPMNRNKVKSANKSSLMEDSISDLNSKEDSITGIDLNSTSCKDKDICDSNLRKTPRQDFERNKRPTFRNLREIFSPIRNNDNTSRVSPRVSHIKAKSESVKSSPITKWTTDRESSCPISSIPRKKPTKYFEGQERDIIFDFESLKTRFSQKFDRNGEITTKFSTIGVLKDVKGGVLLHHKEQKIYLVNLLRLQEMKICYSLVENHCFLTKELKEPITIYKSTMRSEEIKGLDRVIKIFLSDEEFEIVDDRVTKNGFKIFTSSDSIRVVEMTDLIPYLNVDDLREIFRKIGLCVDVSLADSRPYKTAQYLQSEAVRAASSTPVLQGDCKVPYELIDQTDKSIFDITCFHNKPLFHSIYCLEN